jgi:DNA-binding NarL/FixJ family response regulator
MRYRTSLACYSMGRFRSAALRNETSAFPGAEPREKGTKPVRISQDSSAGGSCCCQAEHFTEAEIRVLCLVAGGLSNSEIAGRLSVSGHTVDRHVTQMLRRSGARNRAGLVSAAFRAGILIADQYEMRPSGRRCLLT